MKLYTRIATIVLGAFALGVIVVLGWTALAAEATDISDRLRRARCDWSDTLVVSISGHSFALEATPWTVIFTGETWINGEEVSGYRKTPKRYGFCLDGTRETPLPAQSVTVALDAAHELADQAGLPAVGGGKIEIGVASMFLPGAPAPVGRSSDLIVFHRNADFGWPKMATQGVDDDGFRIGAVCRDGADGGWLCDVSVHDTRTDLAYRFAHLPLETAGFDGQPVPASFRAVAHGLRTLGDILAADEVARR